MGKSHSAKKARGVFSPLAGILVSALIVRGAFFVDPHVVYAQEVDGVNEIQRSFTAGLALDTYCFLNKIIFRTPTTCEEPKEEPETTTEPAENTEQVRSRAEEASRTPAPVAPTSEATELKGILADLERVRREIALAREIPVATAVVTAPVAASDEPDLEALNSGLEYFDAIMISPLISMLLICIGFLVKLIKSEY